MSERPSWMKPHLWERLQQERKEAERTGPVNGEKALVADEKGRVKEVVTDHKPAPAKDLPMPPKNGFGWDKFPETVARITYEDIKLWIDECGMPLVARKRMEWRKLQENQE